MITEMLNGMTSDIGALLWEGVLLVDWKLALALLLTLTIFGIALTSAYYQGMHSGYQYAKDTLKIRAAAPLMAMGPDREIRGTATECISVGSMVQWGPDGLVPYEGEPPFGLEYERGIALDSADAEQPISIQLNDMTSEGEVEHA